MIKFTLGIILGCGAMTTLFATNPSILDKTLSIAYIVENTLRLIL